LSIAGAIEFSSQTFDDQRGSFAEFFRIDHLEAASGRTFPVAQVNSSVSSRGVVRGIHYAEVPLGQAKYVTVSQGVIWDVVVDLRQGSPTFGRWEGITIAAGDARALFIAEGLGHAFVALEDRTMVNYLVSDVYRPDREHGIDPFDADIAIDWPIDRAAMVVSSKDQNAPSLRAAQELAVLPSMEDCRQRYDELATGAQR
jgi:dTDP-4-dehydrorhamnose 3,5-epimerase